ncbi:ptzJ [Candidatus Endolissoclinum faulkneri L5]|uniref:PtzJ n=1 Tax=Candidatus Endolissoclinum faulkneri L5 TaxID=1401328 RepID=V9TSB1_9PROT|nr:enoyl-CoA hydratase-related protein [Candidatus Endolissoclinum faulkneri]AHC73476.1 ptzJ [Candidatus Endolissoclinum faulkneri L5]
MELNKAPSKSPIKQEVRGTMLLAIMDKPETGNTLNSAMIQCMHKIVDRFEVDSAFKVLALCGQASIFCEGMDFNEATTTTVKDMSSLRTRILPFWQLLARFASVPKMVVSVIDGRVSAGGLGLAAASDLVISTNRSNFLLSELMFGLLPAIIAPFLVRRIGWQPAWRMTLTAKRLDAKEMRNLNLIDDLTDDLDNALRRLIIRANRMDTRAIGAAKEYFNALEPMDVIAERRAVDAICARIGDPQVMEGIRRFVHGNGLPWSKSS